MTLNDNIQKKRKELNLTLKNVADHIGVSESTMQRYEHGAINIKASMIEKLAKALNSSPTELMGINRDAQNGDDCIVLEEFIAMAHKAGSLDSREFRKLCKILNSVIDAFIDTDNDF